MILYILRHAIAFPHGTPGVAEDERTLTEEGIKKMKKAALGLKRLDIMPDLILTSPLPRAKQTAEIVHAALNEKPDLKQLAALAPGGERPAVYKALEANNSKASIILVGHQPSLGEIAGEIAWDSAESSVEFKKGGICAMKIGSLSPVPRGTFLWLLTPAILRALG